MEASPLPLPMIRRGVRGRPGVVLLQPARPQVRDGAAHQPRHALRLLEGHGQGPPHLHLRPPRRRRGRGRDAQDAGVLPGQGAPREQDRVGHARVPRGGPGRCRCRPPLLTSQGTCAVCTPVTWIPPPPPRLLSLHLFRVIWVVQVQAR
jgi:hypothetical protein